jgi:hypothetical protein
MRCLALVVLACAILAVPDRASGGTLVQTDSFHIQEHGTTYPAYNQLLPSLGPLNVVALDLAATGSSTEIDLTNNSSAPVSFNLTIHDEFGFDINHLPTLMLTTTIPLTLSAHQVMDTEFPLNGGNPFTASAYFAFPSTAGFVGTGTMIPLGMLDPEISSVDNAAISFFENFSYGIPSFIGTETITYLYGPTAPEPPSFVLLFLGLGAVGVAAWCRRWRGSIQRDRARTT